MPDLHIQAHVPQARVLNIHALGQFCRLGCVCLLHHLVVKGLQSGLCGTRGRKPGVKDILRAEITSRCWEHEQAVRVSFTHHGSSLYACCLSGKKLHKVLVISSRTHRRSCQCCARWTSWTRDLRRPATSCGREVACTRGAGIWPTELPLNISNC